ncbi:MAG: DUF4258 domain-containing protein [Proteobacteria bacterium]|nr:DUF4258 domain-containing protein [Pseudomonadota bacterium]
MKGKLVASHMSAPLFLERVRKLAKESKNIFVVGHARKRMLQRGFTDQDIKQALLKGRIDEGPFLNARHHWQATIYRMYAGQEIRVVTVLEGGIVVITVM